MSNVSPNPNERESRLEQAIAEYLRTIDAGEPVDRAAILAAHPDLADDLRSFFQNRAAMKRLAEPLRAEDTPTMTVGSGGSEAAHQKPTIRYFGDYELLDEIARGGMGVVYRARQVSLNRVVALKMILSGQLASQADVQRFRQEAELAANLDHPGIVPIYEIGEHQGQHYFSMKLIEGDSLRRASTSWRKSRAPCITRTNAACFTVTEMLLQVSALPRSLP